jgi:hypothetical protein
MEGVSGSIRVSSILDVRGIAAALDAEQAEQDEQEEGEENRGSKYDGLVELQLRRSRSCRA